MADAARSDRQFGDLPVSGKLGLLLLLVLLLGALYYLLIHRDLTARIVQERQNTGRLQNELAEVEAFQARAVKLRLELDTRKDMDQQVSRVLPREADIAGVLSDLNRLAEVSGLTINQVEPKKFESSEFYVKIPVDLSLSGRFHQLMRFFHNVSQMERAVSMENVVLGTPKTSDDEVVLTVKVRATAFMQAKGKGV